MPKQIQAGDVLLNVLDEGEGNPLLLVHGFPLDHTMWQRQLPDLASLGRVIAPDLRGFGQSEAGSEEITMPQLADDLAALLDALDIQEAVTFCGLSMGGYVAWQFWKRHPERVNRLILCDTRAAADTEEGRRQRLESAERALREGVGFLVEGMIPRLFAEETRRRRDSFVVETEAVMRSTAPTTVAAALRGMAARPDVTGWLPQIDLPALLVCGEEDAICSVGEMQGMADRLPRGWLKVIPNAGHMAPLEQPGPVNRAIAEFLKE